ncbi:MAG: hypothetical protein HYZ53_20495 [Planctomycetes bacterium]|nr:hypothetical protein [Planctomycetota bacterium]
MQCALCGSRVRPEHAFCPACGLELDSRKHREIRDIRELLGNLRSGRRSGAFSDELLERIGDVCLVRERELVDSLRRVSESGPAASAAPAPEAPSAPAVPPTPLPTAPLLEGVAPATQPQPKPPPGTRLSPAPPASTTLRPVVASPPAPAPSTAEDVIPVAELVAEPSAATPPAPAPPPQAPPTAPAPAPVPPRAQPTFPGGIRAEEGERLSPRERARRLAMDRLREEDAERRAAAPTAPGSTPPAAESAASAAPPDLQPARALPSPPASPAQAEPAVLPTPTPPPPTVPAPSPAQAAAPWAAAPPAPGPAAPPSRSFRDWVAGLWTQVNIQWLLYLGLTIFLLAGGVVVRSQWTSYTPLVKTLVLAGATGLTFLFGCGLRFRLGLPRTGTAFIVLASLLVGFDAFAAFSFAEEGTISWQLLGAVTSVACGALYLGLRRWLDEEVFAYLAALAGAVATGFLLLRAGGRPAHLGGATSVLFGAYLLASYFAARAPDRLAPLKPYGRALAWIGGLGLGLCVTGVPFSLFVLGNLDPAADFPALAFPLALGSCVVRVAGLERRRAWYFLGSAAFETGLLLLALARFGLPEERWSGWCMAAGVLAWSAPFLVRSGEWTEWTRAYHAAGQVLGTCALVASLGLWAVRQSPASLEDLMFTVCWPGGISGALLFKRRERELAAATLATLAVEYVLCLLRVPVDFPWWPVALAPLHLAAGSAFLFANADRWAWARGPLGALAHASAALATGALVLFLPRIYGEAPGAGAGASAALAAYCALYATSGSSRTWAFLLFQALSAAALFVLRRAGVPWVEYGPWLTGLAIGYLVLGGRKGMAVFARPAALSGALLATLSLGLAAYQVITLPPAGFGPPALVVAMVGGYWLALAFLQEGPVHGGIGAVLTATAYVLAFVLRPGLGAAEGASAAVPLLVAEWGLGLALRRRFPAPARALLGLAALVAAACTGILAASEWQAWVGEEWLTAAPAWTCLVLCGVAVLGLSGFLSASTPRVAEEKSPAPDAWAPVRRSCLWACLGVLPGIASAWLEAGSATAQETALGAAALGAVYLAAARRSFTWLYGPGTALGYLLATLCLFLSAGVAIADPGAGLRPCVQGTTLLGGLFLVLALVEGWGGRTIVRSYHAWSSAALLVAAYELALHSGGRIEVWNEAALAVPAALGLSFLACGARRWAGAEVALPFQWAAEGTAAASAGVVLLALRLLLEEQPAAGGAAAALLSAYYGLSLTYAPHPVRGGLFFLATVIAGLFGAAGHGVGWREAVVPASLGLFLLPALAATLERQPLVRAVAAETPSQGLPPLRAALAAGAMGVGHLAATACLVGLLTRAHFYYEQAPAAGAAGWVGLSGFCAAWGVGATRSRGAFLALLSFAVAWVHVLSRFGVSWERSGAPLILLSVAYLSVARRSWRLLASPAQVAGYLVAAVALTITAVTYVTFPDHNLDSALAVTGTLAVGAGWMALSWGGGFHAWASMLSLAAFALLGLQRMGVPAAEWPPDLTLLAMGFGGLGLWLSGRTEAASAWPAFSVAGVFGGGSLVLLTSELSILFRERTGDGTKAFLLLALLLGAGSWVTRRARVAFAGFLAAAATVVFALRWSGVDGFDLGPYLAGLSLLGVAARGRRDRIRVVPAAAGVEDAAAPSVLGAPGPRVGYAWRVFEALGWASQVVAWASLVPLAGALGEGHHPLLAPFVLVAGVLGLRAGVASALYGEWLDGALCPLWWGLGWIAWLRAERVGVHDGAALLAWLAVAFSGLSWATQRLDLRRSWRGTVANGRVTWSRLASFPVPALAGGFATEAGLLAAGVWALLAWGAPELLGSDPPFTPAAKAFALLALAHGAGAFRTRAVRGAWLSLAAATLCGSLVLADLGVSWPYESLYLVLLAIAFLAAAVALRRGSASGGEARLEPVGLFLPPAGALALAAAAIGMAGVAADAAARPALCTWLPGLYAVFFALLARLPAYASALRLCLPFVGLSYFAFGLYHGVPADAYGIYLICYGATCAVLGWAFARRSDGLREGGYGTGVAATVLGLALAFLVPDQPLSGTGAERSALACGLAAALFGAISFQGRAPAWAGPGWTSAAGACLLDAAYVLFLKAHARGSEWGGLVVLAFSAALSTASTLLGRKGFQAQADSVASVSLLNSLVAVGAAWTHPGPRTWTLVGCSGLYAVTALQSRPDLFLQLAGIAFAAAGWSCLDAARATADQFREGLLVVSFAEVVAGGVLARVRASGFPGIFALGMLLLAGVLGSTALDLEGLLAGPPGVTVTLGLEGAAILLAAGVLRGGGAYYYGSLALLLASYELSIYRARFEQVEYYTIPLGAMALLWGPLVGRRHGWSVRGARAIDVFGLLVVAGPSLALSLDPAQRVSAWAALGSGIGLVFAGMAGRSLVLLLGGTAAVLAESVIQGVQMVRFPELGRAGLWMAVGGGLMLLGVLFEVLRNQATRARVARIREWAVDYFKEWR